MITLRIKYADTTVNIQFPCTDNLLMAKLMELHATDHEGDPFFVEEVIEPRDLAPFFETQFVDLDEVNYLAKRMESFMDKEINQFFAASTLEGHSTVKDLINLTFSLERYTLIRDVTNLQKVGASHMLNKRGGMSTEEYKSPKMVEIGKELLSSGKGIPTDYGLVFINEENPFNELYYVHNSHPAIISREIYNKAQEERARRKTRIPQSVKTCITASGKYSKYALTDVLICGECGTRYRRCSWNIRGKKRFVWRCINRLDNGTKYCRQSPTLNETDLHAAVVRAINRFNQDDASTYLTLMKATIGDAIGLNGGSDEIDLLKRRIEALNKRMLDLVNESVMNGGDIESHEEDFKEISTEIDQLQKRIQAIEESERSNADREQRVCQIQQTIQERELHRTEYDDSIVRQMIECIKVYSDGRLQVIFGGGYEIEGKIR